jgi:Protein of unknown function (DUF2975)
MNTNEIAPKANRRMNRIQQVSGIFRTLFFAGVILCALGALAQIPMIFVHVHGSQFEPAIIAATQIVCVVQAWFCFKLFGLYSRRELFSSKVVSYIRRIGYTYFLMAIVAFASQIILLHSGKNDLHPTATHPAWAFDLFGLAGGLFPGFLIIFIAWIMDEGRKIQQEQELTV